MFEDKSGWMNLVKNILFLVSKKVLGFGSTSLLGFFTFYENIYSPIMASLAWKMNIFPPVCLIDS